MTLTVQLVPFSLDLAHDVQAGTRHAQWAEGFPTDGDHEVSGRICEGIWVSPSTEQPWGAWAVLAEGTLVGGAGFHSAPDNDGAVEIGYGIAPEWQGRGIATRAVRMLAEMARLHKAVRLVAATDADNVPSQRVLEHCGFVCEGEAEDELRWSLRLLPESTP